MTFDIKNTIMSQFQNSPRIIALMAGIDKLIRPDEDIKLFYDKYINIMTAQGPGLDAWGLLIGVSRLFRVDDNTSDNTFFGFSVDDDEVEGFDVSPFYATGVNDDLSSFILDDDAYRELLLLKAAANISRVDVASLTALLDTLFPNRGEMYIIEDAPMQLQFVFEFELTPFERALLKRRDLPPKPAGVFYEVIEIDIDATFGFDGSFLQPFDQGTFLDPETTKE